MNPREAAERIREELTEALAEAVAHGSDLVVRHVSAPPDLGADRHFEITLSSRRDPRRTLRVDLPASLAMGYLADEEAAVDEWRRWVQSLRERFA